MKKNRLALAALSLLLPGAMLLSGCSGIFGDDDAYAISGTNVYTDTSGNTVVTITWEDEDLDPLSFVIPAAIAGEDGVGIKDITYEVSEDGSTLTVRITYTDDSPATVISVPIKSGRGVAEVVLGTEDNEGKFCFVYTDGTTSDWISLPTGIAAITTSYDSTTNVTTITITFTDGTSKSFEISNGTNGVGVASVDRYEAGDTDDAYAFIVYYTDGSNSPFSVPKPTDGKDGSQWLTGGVPPADSLGSDGDFYLNTANGYLYHKENGAWVFIFSIKSSDSDAVSYTVIFSANGGYLTKSTGEPMTDDKGANMTSTSIIVEEEGGVISNSAIPLAQKDGYTFEGWFTGSVATDDVTGETTVTFGPNNGQFTDLTPVFGNYSLYAKYSAA